MKRVKQFIQEHTKTTYNSRYEQDPTPWLTPDEAMEAAKIAREETIKDVCEWIKYNNENGGCLFDGWENDLKKHLENKL